MVMNAVEQGRTLRGEYKIKNRQPLAKMHVVCDDEKLLANIQELEALRSLPAPQFTDPATLDFMTLSPHIRDLRSLADIIHAAARVHARRGEATRAFDLQALALELRPLRHSATLFELLLDTALLPHACTFLDRQMASIDHAMWFHDHLDVSD